MNFYDLMMYPLEKNMLREKRALLASEISGQVLEIGYGTGANKPFYDFEKIEHLTALDIKPVQNSENHDQITFKEGIAEQMPFEDASFDVVIETLVLCSVEHLDKTLNEISRVLKKGGKFIFMDHVLPENPTAAKVFEIVNPGWSRIAHGCQLIRSPHVGLDKYGMKIIRVGKFGSTIFSYGIAEKVV